jgi:hypothetical protein
MRDKNGGVERWQIAANVRFPGGKGSWGHGGQLTVPGVTSIIQTRKRAFWQFFTVLSDCPF